MKCGICDNDSEYYVEFDIEIEPLVTDYYFPPKTRFSKTIGADVCVEHANDKHLAKRLMTHPAHS